MPPRPNVRVPTHNAFPNSLKIPSTTRVLVKSLSRLSRSSLIDLALTWLQDENVVACAPYLTSNRNLDEEAEEDYLYVPADTVEQLRQIYESLKNESGSKRDIIDRILDGDWRRGMSLQQLAMIDFQHLQDHDTALRWTALKLVPLNHADAGSDISPLVPHDKPRKSSSFPRIQPATFVQALQHEISPLVKAHYYLHRLPCRKNLMILRLVVADTPYAAPAVSEQSPFTDSARTLYIAFPNSCPYIYVAISGAGGGGSNGKGAAVLPKVDITALKRIVLEAVPKALSRPQERYALETTSLTAKSLSTMCTLRGNGRGGASQGAYSIFTDACVDDAATAVMKTDFESKMLGREDNAEQEGARGQDVDQPQLSNGRKRKVLEDLGTNIVPRSPTTPDAKATKKRKLEVARRFGATGLPDSKHKAPLDRLYIKFEEPFHSPTNTTTTTASITRSTSIQPALLAHFNPTPPLNSSTASPTSSPPNVLPFTLTFHGTDIIMGLRRLAEAGHVELDRMPSWMTGEEGVSGGTVRGGRVVDGKGGGA